MDGYFLVGLVTQLWCLPSIQCLPHCTNKIQKHGKSTSHVTKHLCTVAEICSPSVLTHCRWPLALCNIWKRRGKDLRIALYSSTYLHIDSLYLYKLCGRPPRYAPAPCDLDLWPFDLDSAVRVTCDVDYLCANFSLYIYIGLSVLDLGPMYATDRHQTSDRQTVTVLVGPPIFSSDVYN